MDKDWIFSLIKAVAERGVDEVCLCSGKRNSPLVIAFDAVPSIRKFSHFEERSAAFYCLGRAKSGERPVAICVTSGSAVGELLPAVMEAYYTATPLVLITADRPRRYRGSGAPQSAEQKNIFGIYTPTHFDLEEGEPFSLERWDGRSPLHLNICLEEPISWTAQDVPSILTKRFDPSPLPISGKEELQYFLDTVNYPLVVVSTLPHRSRATVAYFLENLGAPVYAEAISGIRGTIRTGDDILQRAEGAGYPVDGILQLGGVPTLRLWRDLEENPIPLLSLSEVPFSGICNRPVIHTSFDLLEEQFVFPKLYSCSNWIESDQELAILTEKLFAEEPTAEPSLIHLLSKAIPDTARIYLGNSLPIREWDLAAVPSSSEDVYANRGLNGIDGQISTFLGVVDPARENWGIFGDLTTLYDLAGPWAIRRFADADIKIVVINNSGGMLFSRMGLGELFYNRHQLSFKPLADLWGIPYCKIESGGAIPRNKGCQLIEIVPEEAATNRFWQKLKKIRSRTAASV